MLTLRARFSTTLPVELVNATPGAVASASLGDVATFTAMVGREQVRWGDLFEIAGSATDGHLHFVGDFGRVKAIGRGMKSGRITIDGSVGMHAGAEMHGGEMHIAGDTGDWLGAEMRGGTIRVNGNAGDHVGAAYRGSTKGMRGGTIAILGHAGAEVGLAMRRGIIAINGNVGAFVGTGMIAGTIAIGGNCGASAGAGMKRGTLAVLSGQVPILPTFRYSCEYQPPYWHMLLQQLKRLGLSFSREVDQRPIHRYCGDLLALGLGELLIPQS